LKQNDNTNEKKPYQFKENAKINHQNRNKRLSRIEHHFHQPITKKVSIHKIKREKLAKDSENFSPILLKMGEL
jgi:hypothetical protein